MSELQNFNGSLTVSETLKMPMEKFLSGTGNTNSSTYSSIGGALLLIAAALTDLPQSEVIRDTSKFMRDIYSKNIKYIQFLGHSGGGTLAMLLAERFNRTTSVVTLAGNLDIDAWTTLHGYSPLYGSLNPAQRPALAGHIKQFHYVGRNDKVVPPAVVQSGIRRQHNARLIILDDVNHKCCWESVLPRILRNIN